MRIIIDIERYEEGSTQAIIKGEDGVIIIASSPMYCGTSDCLRWVGKVLTRMPADLTYAVETVTPLDRSVVKSVLERPF